MSFISLFLIFAGFIIGLGAITVIDWHGFLAQKSSYWTQATIRTHKVTKPLIWLGTVLLLFGLLLAEYSPEFEQLRYIQLGFMVLIILNGMFLSFWVSPMLLKREKQGKSEEILPKDVQLKITASMLISFIGWWGMVLSFVYYLWSVL